MSESPYDYAIKRLESDVAREFRLRNEPVREGYPPARKRARLRIRSCIDTIRVLRERIAHEEALFRETAAQVRRLLRRGTTKAELLAALDKLRTTPSRSPLEEP